MSYWFRGYFWTPEPPPAMGEADDLLGAVQAAFAADANLTAALNGGLYTEEGPRRTPAGPYAILRESSTALALKTSTSAIHDTRLRFQIYADDLDTAGTIGDALETVFKGRPLSWTGGYSAPLVRHSRRHAKESDWSRGGAEVWYLALEFQCRVVRTD